MVRGGHRIEVRGGRHIESIDWDTDAPGDVESIGDDCEGQTLRRLEISRT